jgi:hypothetical protein
MLVMETAWTLPGLSVFGAELVDFRPLGDLGT